MKTITSLVKTKYTLLALVLVLAVGFGFMNQTNEVRTDNCPGTAPENGPAFNIWPLSFTNQQCRDLPLIDVKNLDRSGRDGRYATSQAEHDAGITAAPNEKVRVAIYFHNGSSDQVNRAITTAINTRITAGVPTALTSSHSLSGGIAADNAQAVYSGMPNTGGNAKVNTTVPARLEYVPGSTELYGQSGRVRGLPDGVVNGSVNIGDVLACFPYSGYVIFTLNVVAEPTVQPADIHIEKTVSNPNRDNQTAYTEQVNARTNDVVNFRLVVTSTGQSTANGVVVTDAMPAGLVFVGGENPTNLNLGNMAPGTSRTVDFTARVTRTTAGVITNVATVDATNTDEDSDSASINVVVPGAASLDIQKTVANPNRDNQTEYVEQVNARQGDVVSFRIVVTSNGAATANNVVMTDAIPSGLEFVSGENPANISMGNMAPGQSRTVNFTARVTRATAGVIVNTANVDASNTAPDSDTASVNVTVVGDANTTITLEKTVRNPDRGQNNYVETVTARQNDIVQYRLVVRNTGNVPALNVILRDPLVNGLQFVDGANVVAGHNLGNIEVGGTRTVEFRARVTVTPPQNQTITLGNIASAQGSNTNEVRDTANVIVDTVVPPQPTGISIEKLVRNVTANRTTFVNDETAYANDRVMFQLTVRNTGNTVLNNVYVRDVLPSGLSFVAGSVRLDGQVSNDSLVNNRLSIGSLNPGQSRVVTFDATVNAPLNTYLLNIAYAGADSVNEVQDTASVTVRSPQVGGANIALAKRAFNDTKNIDATKTVANREDFITYTLTVSNTGSGAAENFVIEDDLSGVLNYATMVEMNGGSIVRKNGDRPYIVWPAVTIPAGGSVTKVFRVRVNYHLPANVSNLALINVYGNEVRIPLVQPQVLGGFVAPRTGSPMAYGFLFAALVTATFAIAQKKRYAESLLNALPKVKIQ
jgi:uncharacterized repeat protein (TIGR01451 family)